MNLLGVSGSIRDHSYNTSLLRSIEEIGLSDVSLKLYDKLGQLPTYDPTQGGSDVPDVVQDFRTQIQTSDALMISTPEYAYGIPGVLKNAMDWVVASGELVMKPVMLTSVSTSELGGARAHHALLTVLHAMNAKVIVGASMTVAFAGEKFDKDGKLQDPLLQQALKTNLTVLRQSIV